MSRWSSRLPLHGSWQVLALAALVLPLLAAAVLSFVPSNRYQATSWIIVDASRGSQAVGTSVDERRGNEVVTYDQVLKTQLSIAGSDEVVRRAIRGLAPVRLYPGIVATEGGASAEDAEVGAARNDMVLAIEPNTFILKIGYRHKDPVLAGKFANSLASEFLARRSGLYANQGDADFFRGQEKRYNDELRIASTALEQFGTEKGVYSIAEQRRLLLEARAAASKELTNNATQIARAESELSALKVQLQALRRRTSLPPEIYGEQASGNSAGMPPARPARRDDTLSDDPPLLNIKIYQDGASKLVTMNAELAGLKATDAQRSGEVQKIEEQLNNLAASEARFNSLRRQVSQAESYIDNLSRRAGEARINDAWRSNEAFSSAQVLQPASTPSSPVSPKPLLTMAAGLVVGLGLSCAVLYVGYVRSTRDPGGAMAGSDEMPEGVSPFTGPSWRAPVNEATASGEGFPPRSRTGTRA